MDGRQLLWTLVAFFGAGLAFNAVGNAAEEQSTGVQILLQVATLALIVGVIVLIVRRQDRG